MNRKAWITLAKLGLWGFVTFAAPANVRQAEAAVRYTEEVEVKTSSSYMIKIDAAKVNVYREKNVRSAKIAEAVRDQMFEVSPCDGGWVLIKGKAAGGYLRVSDGATLVEVTHEEIDRQARARNQVVKYALQFVGKPYVWGGTDPHTGADCSGFTAYVMGHAAGVPLTHASWIQAGEGRSVSDPRPGDLIFYSNGRRINHVAIYIGSGQIVHASSPKNGILVSAWNRRQPVKIVDVLSSVQAG